jgi:hypothetical protein
MTGLKIVVAVEAVTLVLAVGLVLQSEGHESFPKSVPVASPRPASAVAPVSISVDLGSRGTTLTSAALAMGRGGQAVASARHSRNSGSAGFRSARVRSSGRLAG